jgi:hypothetical protein
MERGVSKIDQNHEKCLSGTIKNLENMIEITL